MGFNQVNYLLPFVLIAMVAVSMRLYPDPIIRTSAKVK
jgi:hypothetical protein